MTRLRSDHFNGHYLQSDDPWEYAGSCYERRKYRLTVASLPRPYYDRAFEPGCSVGVLSEMLAARCRHLLSVDMEPRAVGSARARLDGLAGVEVREARVPQQWPAGRFDLVVLSEVLYYLDEADIGIALDRVRDSLVPDGHLVAVHWRGLADDYLVAGGDAVHAQLRRHLGFRPICGELEDGFVLDVMTTAL